MIIYLPAFTQKRKAAGAVAVTVEIAVQEGELDYAQDPTASSSAIASAAPERCPLDGPLSKKEVSRDKERIFSALKENISHQLAGRVDKHIPCHLCRACSLPPILTYA